MARLWRCLGLLAVIVAGALVSVGAGAQMTQSPRARAALADQSPLLRVAMAEQGLALGAPIYIRIFKAEAELEVWVERFDGRFQLFRTYNVCRMGDAGLGPKLYEGDLKSPEGFYFVFPGQLNPWSRRHLSFDIGFPNKYDRAHGRDGSNLMVHGDCESKGCFAVTDSVIEEIYTLSEAALREGQAFFRVHIFPFRMTTQAMRMHRRSRWEPFWENLKQGHDLFLTAGRPPDVQVSDGRYVFGLD